MSNNKLETQNSLEYLSASINCVDFTNRFNLLLNVVFVEFHLRLKDEATFPFQMVRIIDSVNDEFVHLIESVNKTEIIENQPIISPNLFMEILESKMKKMYNQYNHFTKYIYN